MLSVNFYDTAEDGLLAFAVIVARHNNKWVFCKHKSRDTLECPGGHREPGESIDDTAKRELWEETGAADYKLFPVCVYSVRDEQKETFGMLYYAEVFRFEALPELEIEKVLLLDELPQNWTYPLIQPKLVSRVEIELSHSDI